MEKLHHVVIISHNTLEQTALSYLLQTYFSPIKVYTYASYSLFEQACADVSNFHLFFVDAPTFVEHIDFFLPRRNHTITLSHQPSTSAHALCVSDSEELWLENLERIITSISQPSRTLNTDTSKELSLRETEVLKEVVKGGLNKEIADTLHISLNTVLSHRKNITAKLGIKTISGLTYYAIMNGIIAGEDIEV